MGTDGTGIPARRYATIYLALASPILIALCFLTGPFQVPDEPAHFFRAVQISHGGIFPIVGADGRSAGGLVDASSIALVDGVVREISAFGADGRFRPGSILADLGGRTTGPPAYAPFSNIVVYFPTAHLVPALAIAIARNAGAPPLAWFYIGRMANALVALVVSCFAILLFGDAAIFVFMICLLPRVMFEEASFSADALTIPFALLFWALIAGLAAGRTPAWCVVPAFGLAILFACIGKLAYMPLVVLPPAVAWLEGQRRSLIGRLAAVSLFASLLWLAWSLSIVDKAFPIGSHCDAIDMHRQLHAVLQDPPVFLAALARSLEDGKLTLLRDLVGPNVGWVHVAIMPWPIIAMLTMALAAAAGLQRSRSVLRIPTRCVVATVILANLVALYFILYLQTTPFGYPTVEGVQGRYFIPLMAALPALLSGPPIASRRRAALEYTLVACGAVGALSTAVLIRTSYWQL